MGEKQCADCRDGEHENYDDDVHLMVVRDPKTKKIHRRAYLCGEHRGAYLDDGWELLDTHS
jgi:hypothetical protein